MKIKRFNDFLKESIHDEEENLNPEMENEDEAPVNNPFGEEEDEREEEDDRFGAHYLEMKAKLNGKPKKKVDHNTYLIMEPNEDIALRLYQTDIITFHPNGDFTLDNGGWNTVTTRDRINKYLPSGFRVFQKKGSPYVQTPSGKTMDFESGKRLTKQDF